MIATIFISQGARSEARIHIGESYSLRSPAYEPAATAQGKRLSPQ